MKEEPLDFKLVEMLNTLASRESRSCLVVVFLQQAALKRVE